MLDDLSTGFRDALLHGEKLVIGSTGDQALVKKLIDEHQIDAILHFAASIASRVRCRTRQVLHQQHRQHAQADRSRVEGKPQGSGLLVHRGCLRHASTDPCFETDPTEPESPYGWSKLMSERMLRDTAAARDSNT